jgi:spore germination protein YaaH
MHDRYNNSWSRPPRSAINGLWVGLLIFGLLVVLLLAIILLPPIALAERILSPGYTSISSQAGGYVATQDGLYVSIPPEGVQGKTKIKVSVIPRGSFLEGSADSRLVKAAGDIPPWLILESDYYRIQFRGQKPPTRVMVRMPIPPDAEPLGTLDLYAWNGQVWEWLPHFIRPGDNSIEAELAYLPQSVVVMQTKSLQPSVSADLQPMTDVPVQAQDVVAQIDPLGLYLDADGTIRGDPGVLLRPDQATGYTVVPTLRNWEAGAPPRSDLIDNMLVDQAAQEEHIRLIVKFVGDYGYPGLDIDYRGVDPDLRAEYSQFITDLADALHQQGKLLCVRLELPIQVALDRWETGAYDWVAIGAAADTVKIAVPSDPTAYTPDGQMDGMLRWAVGQVNRYKLQLLMTTYSTDWFNGSETELPFTQAMAPFSEIIAEGGATILNPGQRVSFALSSPQPSTDIQFDPNSGLYWYAYLNGAGEQHTVWLENGASIARKLQSAIDYNLAGVAVQNLLAEQSNDQIWKAIREYVGLVIPPVERHLQVVWHVQSAAGQLVAQEITDLTNPRLEWTVPQETGEYRIRALLSSDGSATGPVQGSTEVLVTAPTPTP